MSLLQQADVDGFFGWTDASRPGNWQAMADLAEIACARYCGPVTLEETAVSVTDYEIQASDIGRDGTELFLANGPMVSFSTLELDGADITAQVVADYWALVRATGWLPGSLLTYAGNAGWADAASLPVDVRQAMLLATERQVYAVRGGGVQSERIGDYSVSFGAGTSRHLPELAVSLLTPYQRPRLP